jgi:iron complex outermembrane recepter protein
MMGRRWVGTALLACVLTMAPGARAQDEYAPAESAAPPAETTTTESTTTETTTTETTTTEPGQSPDASSGPSAPDSTPPPSAAEAVANLETIPVAQPPPALPQPGVTEGDDTTHLDEIVVTAQKRAQRLVDVPINVSAMSRDEVQNTRIEQVKDVAGYVPNLDIKEQVPGAIPVVSIRGVGLDDFSSTNSPAAGIYVDGVTLSSLALMSFDMYDIERIEVLKGPQGTLYGRNSTAGAINIISGKATLEKEGFLKGSAGTYASSDLEGMINFPVGEFGVRFAGKVIRQGEGFWQSRRNNEPNDTPTSPGGVQDTLGGLPIALPGGTPNIGVPPLSYGRDTRNDPVVRDIGSRDLQLGRVRIGWDATPYLHLDLKVEGQRQDSEMGQPEGFGSNCEPGFKPIDPDHCTDATGYSDRDREPYKGDWRGDFPYQIHQLGETLLADWDLGFGTLSSVTGYISLRRFFHIDVDGSPADEFDFFQADTVKQWTQELRLAGETGPANWLLGVFGSGDRITVHTDGNHQDLVPDLHSVIDVVQDTQSAAAFANADWKLFERFTLVTGLRYTYESRHYVGGSTWTHEVPGTLESTYLDDKITDSNWSWKLGANFAPTHKTLIYANIAKGVKSGGYFSGVTAQQAQLVAYKPEQLTALEAGFKLQGPFAINTSAFYYDYKDKQTFERSNTAPVQLIGNVDKARLYGADLEATWRALDGFLEGLTLQTGVGVLRSWLGEFPSPNSSPVPGSEPTPVPAGNKLANAPELTVNGVVRYELPLFDTGTLTTWQVDGHYSAATFKEATNDPLIASDSYLIWNARASLLSAERNWEIAVFGKNLTNELYVVNGLDIGAFFFGNRNYNAPRTAGVEVSVRF